MEPIRIGLLLAVFIFAVAQFQTDDRDCAHSSGFGTRAGQRVPRLSGLPRDGCRPGGQFHHGFVSSGEILGGESGIGG